MTDNHEYEHLAQTLGFEYVGTPDGDVMLGIDQLFQGRDFLRYRNVLLKRAPEVLYAVGEMSWSSDSNNDGHRHHYEQTTVYFEGPDLELPPFTIEPAGMLTGLLGGMLSLIGVTRLKTEDHPEFDDKFYVGTMVPDATRPMLSDSLIEFFLDNPEVSVTTKENRVAVAYKHKSIPPEDCPRLLKVSTELIRILTETERETRDFRPSAEEAMQQTLASGQAGLVGMLMGQRINKIELDEFYSQSVPRRIPREIKMLKMGCGSLFVMIWGAMFGLIGSGLLVAGVVANQSELLIFGSVFPLVGFLALFFAWRYRSGIKRILRDGRLVEARVTEVKRTNVEVNNQRRYKVRFVFELDGREITQETNQYGPAVQKATILQQSEETTRLLVDPVNTAKLLWLEPYVV